MFPKYLLTLLKPPSCKKFKWPYLGFQMRYRAQRPPYTMWNKHIKWGRTWFQVPIYCRFQKIGPPIFASCEGFQRLSSLI